MKRRTKERIWTRAKEIHTRYPIFVCLRLLEYNLARGRTGSFVRTPHFVTLPVRLNNAVFPEWEGDGIGSPHIPIDDFKGGIWRNGDEDERSFNEDEIPFLDVPRCEHPKVWVESGRWVRLGLACGGNLGMEKTVLWLRHHGTCIQCFHFWAAMCECRQWPLGQVMSRRVGVKEDGLWADDRLGASHLRH